MPLRFQSILVPRKGRIAFLIWSTDRDPCWLYLRCHASWQAPPMSAMYVRRDTVSSHCAMWIPKGTP